MATEARDFIENPIRYFDGSARSAHSVPPKDLAMLQRHGLLLRFSELRNQLAVLKTMADEQGITTLDDIGDVVPLLFPHTVYKSYPVSLLENNRFLQLTRWLGRLTTHDLSKANVADCDCIDSWLDVLDRDTDLLVAHSSGTSGTMSFLPRSKLEYQRFYDVMEMGVRGFVDPDERGGALDERFRFVWLSFKSGRSGALRATKFFIDRLARGEDHFHALHETALSSDVMFLGGRMRVAAARGETGQIRLSPKMKERRAEFEASQRSMAQSLNRIFEDVIVKYKGERIFLCGTWNQVLEISRAGLARGLRNTFGHSSVVQTGGGAKGMVVPPGWEQEVIEFSGVPRLANTYGMTEITMTSYLCENERYHIPPWIILYVLDPDTGEELPREGVQVGRAAFFDLIPRSFWGGFVSGDEVQIDWSACACGRTTPHLAKKIERFTDKRSGDDKITCAATEEAHRAALDLLTGDLL